MNISIIVISYNSEFFLYNCLQSLSTQSFLPEIIVIDNNSQDKSVEIAQKFDNIKVIELKKNSGYSYASNRGIKESKGDIIIVANPDTLFPPDFCEKLLEILKNNDGEIFSPLILRFDKKIVDSAGQEASLSLFPKERYYNQNRENLTFEQKEIFSVCGACTIFKRSALEKIKLSGEYYDEDFFLFWEDFDIGWRAHLKGIKQVFVPHLIMYHYRSGTLKKKKLKLPLSLLRPAKIKSHIILNRYSTLIKNFSFKKNFKNIPFIIFKDFLWLFILIVVNPKTLYYIFKYRFKIKSAFKKRKLVKNLIKEK